MKDRERKREREKKKGETDIIIDRHTEGMFELRDMREKERERRTEFYIGLGETDGQR